MFSGCRARLGLCLWALHIDIYGFRASELREQGRGQVSASGALRKKLSFIDEGDSSMIGNVEVASWARDPHRERLQ